MVAQKTCFKCNRTLASEEFYRHPKMADGRLGKCKDCTRNDVRGHRVIWRGKLVAYDRARYLSGRRPAPRSPEKRRAKSAISNAVRRGRIEKPNNCQACGKKVSKKKLHGHHEDYGKPLDVKWLCHPCHGMEHRTEEAEYELLALASV